MLRLRPSPQTVPMSDPPPGVTVQDLPDRTAAMAWLTVEYPSLREAVAHAAAAGFDDHAWRLAWSVSTEATGSAVRLAHP